MALNRLIVLSLLLLGSTNAWCGAGGAGNSGDTSIQFNFAQSTAVQILKDVSVKSLFETNGRKSVKDFYQACRQSMFLGALRTRFILVDSIPDGEGYHALAQRIPGYGIRISRTEMEKLSKEGQLTGPFLTGLVLHEVGHDCDAEGVVADDRADGLLNELGESLVRAAGSNAIVHLIDVTAIERVTNGEQIRWLDLSSRVRSQVSKKYADYTGDWLYLKNRVLMSERPAPASDFFATSSTSLFPSWNQTVLGFGANESATELKQLAENLLSGAYEAQDFSCLQNGRLSPLPVDLSCHGIAGTLKDPNGKGNSAIECVARVSWALVEKAKARGAEIRFAMDIFGELEIREVSIKE